MILVYNETL